MDSIMQFLRELKFAVYKHTKYKFDRYHLFVYLSQGLRNGSTSKALLSSIQEEYRDENNIYMYGFIKETLRLMEEEGFSDGESLNLSGMISKVEFRALESISKSSPHEGIEYINERAKKSNDLKYAIGMLFFPTIIVTAGYLIFQPALREMTIALLDPVNSVSASPIPIPPYFEDRTVFGLMFAGMISLVAGIFFGVDFLKKNNPKVLFKWLRLTEREFVINNFEVLLSLLKSGDSPIEAIRILSEDDSDPITKRIFSEIKQSFEEGENSIHRVLKRYKMDGATLSFIRTGEKENFLEESVKMALSYNQKKHEKMVASMVVWLPLVGEIMMTLVLLKPMLDIIIVTTGGALQFQI